MMRKFVSSAIAAALGAVLSWIGLIHAGEVSWAAQPSVALGYAMLAIVLLAFAYRNRSMTAVPEEDDPADLADPVVAEA
jgi:AGZA family xanthine/uracil permease-like MFS transporter